MNGRLTHLDDKGRAVMVDVSSKAETAREATAAGWVLMRSKTLDLIIDGTAPKGDVLAAARLAGIMAAKRTHNLIPLCHPLPLAAVTVDLRCDAERQGVEIRATVKLTSRTGAEMEALTAVSVAALTIYDMVKAVDRGMRLTDIKLIRKSGGKSGDYKDKS